MAQGALADPKVIVTAVIYSSTLRLGFSRFPPLAKFQLSDWLRLHVLVLLIARITLTYSYAGSVAEYDSRLFFLELLIAFLVAAQFRALDEFQDDGKHHTQSLPIFFGLQSFVFATTFPYGSLTNLPWTRFFALRVFLILSSALGIASEWRGEWKYRDRFRRYLTTFLVASTLWYFFIVKPWTTFSVAVEQSSTGNHVITNPPATKKSSSDGMK